MRRAAALLWLAAVLLAGIYLASRIERGLTFDTDLMALLPREERDPAVQRANDVVARTLAERIVIMAGDRDPAAARDAANSISRSLLAGGAVTDVEDNLDAAHFRQIGTLYYPYRTGLLSSSDRARLAQNGGEAVANRALAQAYTPGGFADARLLQADPFLLFPAFLSSLPVPASRLAPLDGFLTVQDKDLTWIFLSFRVTGSPFALATQDAVISRYDAAVAQAVKAHPDLAVLHTGALFFAARGARQALNETTAIGIASLLGTILFLLLMFRRAAPAALSFLVIGAGVLVALSASLTIFGTLHVGALLFGVSLIGVAADYSLQYCGETFSAAAATPRERLRYVLPGITLGTTTTVIGYLTLLLAPFPGLRQVAAFSAIGLMAAWLTVVLWLPTLDRMAVPAHAPRFLDAMRRYLAFWTAGRARFIVVAVLVLAGIGGLARFHVDDDVRHLQSLPPDLARENKMIAALTGHGDDASFFVVQETDDEAALQTEEHLADRLRLLVAQGELGGFQTLADYIPSVARQRENRQLVLGRLYRPLLRQQAQALHLATLPEMPAQIGAVLTPSIARAVRPVPMFVDLLSLTQSGPEAIHIVTLDGVRDRAATVRAAQGLPGVRLVDPVTDYSDLLRKYRSRALALLVISAGLMAPLLFWRYGLRRGAAAMGPPLIAILLTPGLRALCGGAFTFFDAMGLVLILAIGVDYAVFFAEAKEERRPVTMLAVLLAAGVALLSFGLLALSRVAAVNEFGATMLVGISLCFLFAPWAGKDRTS